MACCFNSFGPVQTYVISRVWACSHALLAGLPFLLNPLQSGFAAGIRWGVSGVLGLPPECCRVQLTLPEASSFSLKSQEEKRVLCAQT